MSRNNPMTVEDRGVTLRDFIIFQLKLLIDGGKDAVVFGLSIGAMVLDYIAGNGKRPRLFYSVMRMSRRFDDWLNLHSSLDKLEQTDDKLFTEAGATSDKLLADFEELVRNKTKPGNRGVNPPRDPK